MLKALFFSCLQSLVVVVVLALVVSGGVGFFVGVYVPAVDQFIHGLAAEQVTKCPLTLYNCPNGPLQ